MKFCKKYNEYMQGVQSQRELPGVGFKKLKKVLKNCRCRKQIDYRRVLDDQNHSDDIGSEIPQDCRKQIDYRRVLDDQNNSSDDNGSEIPQDSSRCGQGCQVCDEQFFPELLNEMSEVVEFFNHRAQKLLDLHLSSGFSKCFMWLKQKLQGNQVALVQEGRDLVTYAIINGIAVRKILKKYDKIHYSKEGQAFKSKAQSMHIEILQSPWLCELMAFHINLRESNDNSRNAPALFNGCSLVMTDGKLSLSCELFDSVKLDIDLTCSICLETLFDPISLNCGHIFCYMCACKAGSVTIVDGLTAASSNQKCPICREEGVYEAAAHLEELHILLNRSCPEYWEERRQSEKRERLQQVKEHWESQCRLFTGI